MHIRTPAHIYAHDMPGDVVRFNVVKVVNLS